MLYGRNSLVGPTKLYVVDGRARSAPQKLTGLNDAKVAAARFGSAEPFAFTGSGGVIVHGWIVRPVDCDPKKKYPVAFLIHGGPRAPSATTSPIAGTRQAYAGAGYVAVMVDFAGSTANGRLHRPHRGDWGGAPTRPDEGPVSPSASFHFLDRARVCALGASTAATLSTYRGKTDRFKCLVATTGTSTSTPPTTDRELWFPEWEHGGPAYTRTHGLHEAQPDGVREELEDPMLVIHGEKTTAWSHPGLATFTALQRKGIPSKLLVFPDENHWVQSPRLDPLARDGAGLARPVIGRPPSP